MQEEGAKSLDEIIQEIKSLSVCILQQMISYRKIENSYKFYFEITQHDPDIWQSIEQGSFSLLNDLNDLIKQESISVKKYKEITTIFSENFKAYNSDGNKQLVIQFRNCSTRVKADLIFYQNLKLLRMALLKTINRLCKLEFESHDLRPK